MNFIKKNIIFTIVAAVTLIGVLFLIYLDWTKHDGISAANLVTQDSQKKFDEAFRKCDLMATPVTPTVAFRFGEKADPLQMKLSDIFTIALNLAGNCGVSIPAGLGRDSGMPVGMQLLAPAMCEDALLGAAAVFETLHPVVRPDL